MSSQRQNAIHALNNIRAEAHDLSELVILERLVTPAPDMVKAYKLRAASIRESLDNLDSYFNNMGNPL